MSEGTMHVQVEVRGKYIIHGTNVCHIALLSSSRPSRSLSFVDAICVPILHGENHNKQGGGL